MVLRWWLVASVLSLGGCALFSGDDNRLPPAPLPELTTEIGIKTVWQRQFGSGSGKTYTSLNPAAVQDRLFVADRKGRVWAVDRSSGKPIWEQRTDTPATGGLGAGAGLVLLGSRDGRLSALAEADGRLAWQITLSSEILAPPQAAANVVAVRTGDGKLYGLSAQDGELIWVYEQPVPALSLHGTSGPILIEEVAIAGFANGTLAAVRLADGQVIWERRLTPPQGRSELERMVDIDAQPVRADSSLYAATFQGHVAAVELYSGEIAWRRELSSNTGLAVDNMAVYVSDDQGHVWALDRRTGASLWRQSKLQGRDLGAPTVFRDFVLVGDFEGYLHWLRREDGQFAGRARVGNKRIAVAPLPSAEAVYVFGRGGVLARLSLE
jgi:outer membrane protein assembly factor BamB